MLSTPALHRSLKLLRYKLQEKAKNLSRGINRGVPERREKSRADSEVLDQERTLHQLERCATQLLLSHGSNNLVWDIDNWLDRLLLVSEVERPLNSIGLMIRRF